MNWEIDFLKYVIDNIHNPLLDKIMLVITSLGNAGFIWIALAILFLIIKPLRKEGISMAISLVLVFIVVNIIIKPLAGRLRPFEVSEYILNNIHISLPWDPSFPSGHTAAAFAASFGAAFKNRKIGIPLIVLAFLMGLSRIYFAVHFPTDVIAGMILGIISAYIGCKISSKYIKNS